MRSIYLLMLSWLVLSFLLTFKMPLHYDEAYYWVLSNHLDFGYYDHPPLNMYLIRLSQSLFGISKYSVRLPSILYQLASIWLIYIYLIDLTKNSKISFWWSAIYALMPLAFFWGGSAMNGDAGVITFSILSTLILKKAISHNELKLWIYFGITCGLGILTKFTFLTLLPGLFLYLVANPERRKFLWRKEIYVSIGVACLILTPFFIWNYHNSFATFFFNMVVRHRPFQFEWQELLMTIQVQLSLFGPLTFVLSLIYLVKTIRSKRFSGFDTDPSFFVQLVLVLFFFVLGSGSVIKWHYMIVLCVPIVVNSLSLFYGPSGKSGWVLNSSIKKVGIYSVLCMVIGALLISLMVFTFLKIFSEPRILYSEGYQLTENEDPQKKYFNPDAITFLGQEEVGLYFEGLMLSLAKKDEDNLFVVARDYREASQLSFNAPSHPEVFLLGNRDIFGRNYIFFRQENEPRLIGKNAIYITQYPSSFSQVRKF
ncbi:MAG: glycosyltransferase family 39 protein, partial [Proteobacteria bacterium]|nr:glycosyltransferase family 39 protein [Pseudomonadota bacterium]